MANRQIVIDIVGDADSFSRATNGAIDKTSKLSGGLKHSAVAGAAAGVAMGGVTMALGFVTDALSGSAEAAKEDTASQDRLALALKNTGREQALSTEQIEAAISANQAKGVSDSEQRQGISDFLDVTKDATQAMALNTATIELAAAKGIEYAEAESIIRSAAAGKTAALEKAGVQIEAGTSITDIATKVTDKFGGSLDRVAQTQGGKSRIANEKMGEAMEKVGRIVNKVAEVALPILADAMEWVVDNVIPPLQRAFEILGPIIGEVFRVAGRIVGTFVDIIQRAGRVIGNIAEGVGDVFETMADIVTDAWNGITDVIRGVINTVIDIVNGAIRAINSVSFTTPDWLPGEPVTFSANIGYIPRLHAGGIVPGLPGQEVLTVLQAGERVTPAAAGGGNAYSITVQSLDPQTAATLVVRAIDEWERSNGHRFARV